jgi:hypothetical protein
MPPCQVVFVREGVSVCPSRNECIKGRLSLVKQHHVMFLAWLPYNHGALQEDGTFQLDAEKDLLQEACNLKGAATPAAALRLLLRCACYCRCHYRS